MTDGVIESYRGRGRDRARERQIWVTGALSLLIHALLLWGVPGVRLPTFGAPELGEGRGPLVVRLALPPMPAQPLRPPPVPAVKSARSAKTSPPSVAQSRSPPVLALKQPGRGSSSAAPSVSRDAALPRPPVAGDLSSYIEARRRARGETAPAAASSGASSTTQEEDENARASRLAAANLAAQRPSTLGYDPKRGGGIFQIEWLGTDSGAFLFYGWNPEVRRNTAQVIEVRRGDHGDIRIAMVRRMIAIIREYEQGDFLWQSPRLERTVTLSARAGDSAALEEFMMREFFSGRWRP